MCPRLGLYIIGEHKAFLAVLILIGAGIVAFQTGAYYYYQKSTSACSTPCLGPTVKVETLINYGNTTSQWINKTDVPFDWNFYQLTTSISRVQATYYGPPTSEHLITSINGVQSKGQYFWSLWAICEKSDAWIATSVGADALHFTTYHTFAWYYQAANSQDSSNWKSPVPGAAKVTMC
ncbi:MAG: hypothetical protein AUI93_03170 [Crenarchaeota archaeon 13_1_40CM_3_52_10]|nr:MAG: hypothetical protein AUI93_03170 [Crenarchaeota archaeon 13_1_40CM_3_52_10]